MVRRQEKRPFLNNYVTGNLRTFDLKPSPLHLAHNITELTIHSKNMILPPQPQERFVDALDTMGVENA